MKSIFTKLSTLLLCGVVAMVGCTDFSEDIQNLDNKVDNLGNTTQTELATLQKAITDLEAKLAAQYATKDEVAALKATLENSIASEVAALSEDIAAVSDALKTAKGEINEAIADLDDKKADKTAVDAAIKTATEAIAALQSQLEAAKGELEAEIESVKAEIADAQEQLNSKIDGVDAKAEELHNTILALSDYLKTLEAKVNELKGTLDALSEYLPTIEAKVAELKGTLDALSDHLEGREAEVDAKLNELHTTLLALSDHLEEYEATTDFKLVELQGSLAALSVYLEEYEASVDAKFKEILNTFDSLDGFLDDKFAALEATDTDLYKEIEGVRVVLTALNNLLTDEAAARMEEDNALYELIGTSVTALNNLIADLEATDTDLYKEIDGVRQAFTTLNNLLADEVADRTAEDAAIYELIGSSVTALNNLIADLEAKAKADDDAIYVEIENVRTYVAQVYNALSAEIAATNAALDAHIAAFEAYKKEMAETIQNLYKNDDAISERLAMHTDKLAKIIDAKVAELQAADEEIWTKINSLEESLSQAINYLLAEMEDKDEALYTKISEETAAKFEVVEEAVSSLYFQVADLQTEVAELANQVLANTNAIASLENAVEMLTNWALTHEGLYGNLTITVGNLAAELGEQAEAIKALQEEDGAIYEYIGETATNLNNLIADANVRMDEIEVYIKENFDLHGSAIRNLENLINDIQADLNDRVSANEEAIKKLFERVQSLVYVPDYDDHKATISWAELSGEESYGILVKKSVLRYRVYAKADEDAVAAAKAIENAWTPESFYYEVEPVKRAWTRSATVPASLEITDVWAEGEYLNVEVLAKNFNPEFFFSYWYGDNYPRFAMENRPEEGKPVDEKSSYSVSLVLTDGNNNRSTEYTNLVPAYPEYIQAVVLDGNKKDITFMECPETEPANLLPYDLDPKEVVVLKDHALSFVWEGKNYSAAELIAAGYDIQLERRQRYTYPDEPEYQTDFRVDGKPQDFAVLGNDVKFQIHEKDFVSEIEEGNTYVTLTRALTKEEYLALEDKTLDVQFYYNVNGVEVYTTSTVEVCNRLVVVDLGDVEIPWTMELAYNLHDGTKAYALPVKYTGYEYDLAKCANKPLEGYNLYSILQTGSPKKTHGGDYDIQMSISDKTLNFTLSGNYAFANVYDQDGWNDHTVQWVNEFDDLTITVKANIKLGQIPGTLVETDSDLKFKLVPGVNGWVYANSTIVEKMFAKYRDLIGFADDDEAAKAFFSERLAASKVLARELNGEINTLLDPQNIDTPIYSFDPLKLGIHQSQITDAEKQTMFVQQWDKVTGANFAFEFDGTVVLPEFGLEYSTVDFVSYDSTQERWEVEVDGDIVADASVAHGRKYTIDQADLGKYFYVNDNVEYGVETTLTVQFEILTENAPLPLDTDVVGVFEDASSQINVLEEGKSVIKDWTNGGLFVGNEIEVKATLLANGFPIDTKDVTLYTVDPLTFSKTGDMVVERVPGKDAIAYTHSVLSLTSIAEEGNLINTESYPSQVFVDKYANEVYGAAFISQPVANPEWNCQLVRVYTLENGEKVTYPGVKYMFNNGKVTLIADDGLLKQSIFAEVEYKLTHNYNYGQDETVTVVVEFKPNNTL